MTAKALAQHVVSSAVLKWIAGVLASLLVAAVVTGFSKVARHETRIEVIESVLDERHTAIIQRLDRIEEKLDR